MRALVMLFTYSLALDSPTFASDYALALSRDSTAACAISFSMETESVDGTHPLQSGDNTNFACMITETDPDLKLDENDLRYVAGLDYRVSDGEVVGLDLQTTTTNELQIGNSSVGTIDRRWRLFGTGTLFNDESNRAALAEDAGPNNSPVAVNENIPASKGDETKMHVPPNDIGTDVATVTVTQARPLTFSQQAAAMSPGEWKKLDTVNHFTSPGVGHTVKELDAICAAANPPCLIRLYGGHQASLRVFRAWNGAAWDDAGNRMFFWGGGHASYGGNEVYTFDFDTLTWARLTEAKPLNFDPGGGLAHPPDGDLDGIADTPPTPHVYDATEFDPDTGELVVALGDTIYPSCCKTSGYNKSWRFDPRARTWTHHDGHDYRYASCVYVTESTEMLCLDGFHTRKHRLYFIDNDGTETDCGGMLIGGTQAGRIANVFRDDTSGKYYDLRKNGIHEITPSGCSSSSRLLSAPDDDLKSKFTKYLQQSGAARGGDTKIYMWAGTEKILTFDTVTRQWDIIWNEASRGNAPDTPTERDGLYRVFDKWRYFPTEGVFAGIADGDPDNGGGWWLWKPGPNPGTTD